MSLPMEEPSSYRFGAFELDVARKELHREGAVVAIAPKPLELLTLLVRCGDRVVSRPEALAAVWPDVTVSPATLASTLRDLRRALQDDAQAPGIIETARGLGFRFIAPVEVRPARTSGRSLDEAPFVGREALLERFEDALAAVVAGGRGAVVVLEGEPGVGKTRLLTAFADAARAAGAIACLARFPEGTPESPYRQWQQLLAALVESRPPARLVKELGADLPWVARLVPGLSAEPVPEAAPDLDDEGATFRLFDAVARFLRRVAASAPLVLVFDDLHGADRSSLRLLEFLAEEIRDARILLAGAYRSCELDPEHPLPSSLAELARLPSYRRLRLEGVDLEATRALVRAAIGRDPGEERIAEIHARTDGNPFYVHELARYLAEFAPDARVPSVPPGLGELLRGRLRLLPLRCRDTLELAAVVGREFALDVLRRGSGLGVSDLMEALEVGRRAGLVELGWGNTRRFQHALVQEAIYESLPEPRRRVLHRRVGEACRALAGADHGEYLALAAHHLCAVAEDAGEGAIDAAGRAAEQAEAQLAFDEAASLHRLALEALDRVAPGDHQRRAVRLLALARAQLRSGELGLAIGTARRVAALAGTIRRPDLAVEAALLFGDYVLVDSAEPRALLEESLAALGPEHEALRGRGLAALANALWYDGQSERRLALAEQALAIAHTVGQPRDVVTALLAKHHAHNSPADLQKRLLLADQALREADRLGQDALRCLALSWRAIDLLEAGDRVAAERDVARLDEIARTTRQRHYLDRAARWRAMLATIECRFSDAEEQIAESVRLRQRADLPPMESYASIQLGNLLRERGRPEELAAVLFRTEWFHVLSRRVPGAQASIALIELESGRPGPARRLLTELAADDFALLRRDADALLTVSFVAEICDQLDAPEIASWLYDRMVPFQDQFVSFYAIGCRGSFARHCGLLAAAAGRLDEAQACFEAALAANRALGATLHEAWTLWDLARLLLRRGETEQARARADEARALAVRHGLHRLREQIERQEDGLRIGAA